MNISKYRQTKRNSWTELNIDRHKAKSWNVPNTDPQSLVENKQRKTKANTYSELDIGRKIEKQNTDIVYQQPAKRWWYTSSRNRKGKVSKIVLN